VVADVPGMFHKGDPPELLEADKRVADLRKEKEDAKAAIVRLSSPVPDDDLCPTCFLCTACTVNSFLRPIRIPRCTIVGSAKLAITLMMWTYDLRQVCNASAQTPAARRKAAARTLHPSRSRDWCVGRPRGI
jgi:hypothetical protein